LAPPKSDAFSQVRFFVRGERNCAALRFCLFARRGRIFQRGPAAKFRGGNTVSRAADFDTKMSSVDTEKLHHNSVFRAGYEPWRVIPGRRNELRRAQ
jgi:hypothetical protein